jgi:hypothetical protein
MSDALGIRGFLREMAEFIKDVIEDAVAKVPNATS